MGYTSLGKRTVQSFFFWVEKKLLEHTLAKRDTHQMTDWFMHADEASKHNEGCNYHLPFKFVRTNEQLDS